MFQKSLRLEPYQRGFHLITDILEGELRDSGVENGIAHFFVKHTSASLTIKENVDPSVRSDMEAFLNDTCDGKGYFIHTYEGSDDMPAHLKASLLGSSVTIPLTDGKLNLGIWQGIYLGEHRNHAGGREIMITVIS